METNGKWWAAVLAAAFAAQASGTPPAQPAPPEPPGAPQDRSQDRQVEETAHRMEATPAERRDELRALARTADRMADERIRALQADVSREWSRLGVKSRQQAQVALDTARREQKEFAEQMKKLDGDSAAAWVDLRSGVVAAYRDLAHALATARSEYTRARDERSGDTARKNDQEEAP